MGCTSEHTVEGPGPSPALRGLAELVAAFILQVAFPGRSLLEGPSLTSRAQESLLEGVLKRSPHFLLLPFPASVPSCHPSPAGHTCSGVLFIVSDL